MSLATQRPRHSGWRAGRGRRSGTGLTIYGDYGRPQQTDAAGRGNAFAAGVAWV